MRVFRTFQISVYRVQDQLRECWTAEWDPNPRYRSDGASPLEALRKLLLFVASSIPEKKAIGSQGEHSPDYAPDMMLQTCPSCGKRVTVEQWAGFEGICVGCEQAIRELLA